MQIVVSFSRFRFRDNQSHRRSIPLSLLFWKEDAVNVGFAIYVSMVSSTFVQGTSLMENSCLFIPNTLMVHFVKEIERIMTERLWIKYLKSFIRTQLWRLHNNNIIFAILDSWNRQLQSQKISKQISSKYFLLKKGNLGPKSSSVDWFQHYVWNLFEFEWIHSSIH
jgi:hypothetical protein